MLIYIEATPKLVTWIVVVLADVFGYVSVLSCLVVTVWTSAAIIHSSTSICRAICYNTKVSVCACMQFYTNTHCCSKTKRCSIILLVYYSDAVCDA